MRQVVIAVLAASLLAAVGGRPVAAQPVPGVWRVDPVPGTRGECRARRDGQPIDLMMLLNNKGEMILSPARPDWDNWGKDELSIGLGIDDAPAVHIKAYALGPSFMTLMSKDLTERLRHARTLTWDLPTGRFVVEVTGIGGAYDRLLACRTAGHAKIGSAQ